MCYRLIGLFSWSWGKYTDQQNVVLLVLLTVCKKFYHGIFRSMNIFPRIIPLESFASNVLGWNGLRPFSRVQQKRIRRPESEKSYYDIGPISSNQSFTLPLQFSNFAVESLSSSSSFGEYLCCGFLRLTFYPLLRFPWSESHYNLSFGRPRLGTVLVTSPLPRFSSLLTQQNHGLFPMCVL